MNEWEVKKLIVEVGKRMWLRGFVASNDGNISVKLNDNEILTTPTGVSKGFMSSEMIIKVDKSGKVLSAASNFRPSSELKMHLEVYKERADVKAVVHAHPPFATSFAVAGIPLDKCVLPEAIMVMGAVPIAPFGLPSTNEVPESIRPFIKNSDAVLLQNHGALTMADDLLTAYYKMETLEHTASIVAKALQLGNLNVLPENERDRLMNLRENYNMKGKVTACDASASAKGNSAYSKPKNLPEGMNESDINKIVKEVLVKIGKA